MADRGRNRMMMLSYCSDSVQRILINAASSAGYTLASGHPFSGSGDDERSTNCRSCQSPGQVALPSGGTSAEQQVIFIFRRAAGVRPTTGVQSILMEAFPEELERCLFAEQFVSRHL